MTDKKNPQEQTVTFQRRTPTGEWETTDAKGNKIEQPKPSAEKPSAPQAPTNRKSAKTAETQGTSQPTKNTSTEQTGPAKTPGPRTGPLPKNTVGYGKLAAMEPPVETFEQLREATDEQLTAAGLDAEQIGKLREVQAQLAKD